MAVILVVNYGYAYIGIGALNGYIIAIIVVQLGTRYCYWCLLDWKIVKTVLSYLNIVHLKWQMKRNGRATNGKGNETKWNRSRKQQLRQKDRTITVAKITTIALNRIESHRRIERRHQNKFK